MNTATTQETPLSSKKSCYPFIKLPYPIKEAPALTRTSIALYEAIVWFQRNKIDCFPGYEKLKGRAKIKSKSTLSLHLKVLVKVGLIKKQRRGKMQSNIYQALDLSPRVTEKLRRSHASILEEIARDDEKARHLRAAKRTLRSKKLEVAEGRKEKQVQTYPHGSEVQLLDSKKALRAFSRYSSNLNHNDSKIKIGRGKDENIPKETGRGGGFKPIGIYLSASLEHVARGPRSGQDGEMPQPGDKRFVEKFSPLPGPTEDFRAQSKIREVMAKISSDIRDTAHMRENVRQAMNIFRKIRKSREVSADGFIQALWNARGLTIEILGLLDRPGAYFFSILRDRWSVNTS